MRLFGASNQTVDMTVDYFRIIAAFFLLSAAVAILCLTVSFFGKQKAK